jgi:hypothetical protein
LSLFRDNKASQHYILVIHEPDTALAAIISAVPVPTARGTAQPLNLSLETSMFKKLVPVLGALLVAGSLAVAPVAAVAAQTPTPPHHVVKKTMHKAWAHKKWTHKKTWTHKKWAPKKTMKHMMKKKKGA